jgi:exosome complex component RRP40
MAKKRSAPTATTSDLHIVLPGDNVTEYIITTLNETNENNETSTRSNRRLGTGLRYSPHDGSTKSSTPSIHATLAGRLLLPSSTNKTIKVPWIQQSHRGGYWHPQLHDRVVGIIQERIGSDGAGGDLVKVYLRASTPAVVSTLSFEGATKRHHPHLQPGQVIYARVAEYDPHVDLVLSCQAGPLDPTLPRTEWLSSNSSTNNNKSGAGGGYGLLYGGTLCTVSTGLARELLQPDNLVLAELARAKLAFEVVIGVNGTVWIHSPSPETTILIQNAIQNSEVLTEAQVRSMVQSLVYTMRKHVQQHKDASGSASEDEERAAEDDVEREPMEE